MRKPTVSRCVAGPLRSSRNSGIRVNDLVEHHLAEATAHHPVEVRRPGRP